MAPTTDGRRRRRSTATFTLGAGDPGDHRRRARRRCRARASAAGWRSAGSRRSATTRTRRSRRPRSSMIDGERYSIPGDYATVEADGTVRLLGRGSQCINTGGEKVYPEEVEEVLKRAPDGRRRGRRRRARRALRRGDHRARRARARRTPSTRRRSSPTSRSTSPATRRRSGSSPSTSIGRAANGKLDYRALQAPAPTLVATASSRLDPSRYLPADG